MAKKTSRQQQLLSLYRTIATISQVETSLVTLFSDDEIPGFIHLSLGQEAVAAGVCAALAEADTLATTHRGHGHVIARGLDLELFYKEVMGKRGGVCGGRGGSMHVADMNLGILGANGIVGAGIPIAAGSALAHQVRQTGGVAVSFFGDGAMAEGVLHETLNISSLWKLPLLLVCENNGWSEFSPTSRQFVAKLKDLAAAFGLRYETVDGSDVLAVKQATDSLLKDVRKGKGPAVLECITHRVRGHFEGDAQKYREDSELESIKQHEPGAKAKAMLLESGVSEEQIIEIDQSVQARINDALEAARRDQDPSFTEALNDVYTPQQ